MNFPDEIRALIFHHLDIKSLKKCLEVSESCRELVIRTPRLMKRLPVKFYENWRDKLPFVKKYGCQVTSMEFIECSFHSIKFLKEILNFTPNLEDLKFDKVSHTEDETLEEIEDGLSACFQLLFGDSADLENEKQQKEKHAADDEIILRKLAKLDIDLSYELSIPFISAINSCVSLTTLKKKMWYGEKDPSFGEFLARQNDLKSLSAVGYFSSWTESVFNENFVQAAKFKLKTLNVYVDLEFDQIVSTFLLKQAESLEELALHDTMNFHYYRLIFNNFRNLRKLTLSIVGLFNSARLAEIKNFRLLTVKELEFEDRCKDAAVINTLLKIFPNIEVLKTSFKNFSMTGIMDHLPKLKKLTAFIFYPELLLYAKSLSLVELEIKHFYPLMVGYIWKRFAIDYPNIERLIIKEIDPNSLPETVNTDIDILLKSLKLFKNLKFCRIENTFEWMTHAVNDGTIETEPIQNQTFKFILDKQMNKSATISITNYFNTFHAEAIRQVLNDFDANEALEISYDLEE